MQENSIDTCVVFSSAMALYTFDIAALRHVFVDFVDVDSAKWAQYAERRAWPLSWLFRREAARLLIHERKAALAATRAFFVTEAETALFCSLAPECTDQCATVGNGVDAQYFSPEEEFPSPFQRGEFSIVFTGTMDYWPNSDAVRWFASEVLPSIRESNPAIHFVIVGMHPGPEVANLACKFIRVTGTVPDVRPYLRHADLVVAPLRVARGIQNKILEAMAMARPVVTSFEGAEGIEAENGRDYIVASNAIAFIRHIRELISDPSLCLKIGQNARARVIENYSWQARLRGFDVRLRRSDGETVTTNTNERRVDVRAES